MSEDLHEQVRGLIFDELYAQTNMICTAESDRVATAVLAVVREEIKKLPPRPIGWATKLRHRQMLLRAEVLALFDQAKPLGW